MYDFDQSIQFLRRHQTRNVIYAISSYIYYTYTVVSVQNGQRIARPDFYPVLETLGGLKCKRVQ